MRVRSDVNLWLSPTIQVKADTGLCYLNFREDVGTAEVELTIWFPDSTRGDLEAGLDKLNEISHALDGLRESITKRLETRGREEEE